jgi:tight adherence protein B
MTQFDFDTYNILTSLVVFLTALAVLWAAMSGRRSSSGQLEDRLNRLGFLTSPVEGDESQEEKRAREAMQRALVELDTLKNREGRFFLTRLLTRSGTERSLARHVILTLSIAVVIQIALLLFGLPVPLATSIAFAIGIIGPILHLRYLAQRRMRIFADELPGALDLIVRGIRAGLPLLECLQMVVDEWNDPLKQEFTRVTNDMGMGLSIRDAIVRFADRVPVLEARLFAIVISLQSQSGGNLSEVLSNLADMLREKAKLQSKIRAMTSEARTSAWIIGSIPILLIGAVTVLSPDFLKPLFETEIGNVILMFCGGWMFAGFVVMRGMMRVEI